MMAPLTVSTCADDLTQVSTARPSAQVHFLYLC
jgi:hypothetical protein